MMKIDWLKTLILCASIVIAGFFVGNMHKTGKKYDRFVQVKGLSEREVDADLAVWPINITLTANDLNALKTNIEKYTNMSSNDSLIFYHLLYKQPQTKTVADAIHYASTYNSFLILRLSYYEEAKAKGIDIITNFELRDKIKRIYEDDYATLLRIENEDIAYDYEGIMNPKFQNYIGVKPNDKNGTEVYILDYKKLIEDTQFHQEMFKYWQIKNRLRLRNYLPVRIKVINLIEALDKEINRLNLN